ncbi:MAG: glycoside hydrolase family 127 protein [candidate division KSB1 bacterium]|nr:glycoside hydrolase family 127 protein [candidate division KSB1 bacterium]MDZ7301815.1 glycoside hydrolase family 127 protein [candidate division KSB1 bacterium]MDZ7314159.1 glycoside hydrolase family 127 protein [candidate division KSB1 bacterium]
MNRRMQCLTVGTVFLLFAPLVLYAANLIETKEKTMVRVINSPATTGGNNFYIGNRAPLLASPLIKLPVGCIKPEGWLRQQLQLMAEGFTGKLTEISKWCRYDGNAWVSANGEGEFGWEELPYWLKGFIDLGYVLNEERMIKQARQWVEGVLTSQEGDGYFGPRLNKKNHDIWPNMVMLYVLRTHYEATKDQRVLDLMTKYCRWLTAIPLEQYLPESWQKWRGGDNLDHIYWLYNQTGEKWLLDLARVNHERTADWTGGIPTWHGVNLCQGFREPAEYYQQTGDIRYLQATERNYDTIMSMYGQVPGGMFGADENARPGYIDPRQGAETCSMVEFMHSFEMLLKITGNIVWADRAEEVAFNSLPAALTPDLKGLHYLTAPNMVQLDRMSKAPMFDNSGDMLSYNPWQYRCCQHNVAFGWPYYAEHLWLATQNHGLAAALYSASTVTAKVGSGLEVRITETTDYPFDEVVEFKFSASKAVSFPFLLRIPNWCREARVQINGEKIEVQATPASWLVLERNWKNGDVVHLELPMTISVKTWAKNNNAISVARGPLTYALKIGERWERYGGADPWPAYEVFPTTSWNYGLVVDPNDPSASFEVAKTHAAVPAQPFTPENVPVSLRAKGKRITGWKLESNGLIGTLPSSPVRSDEPLEEVVLIPMGAARLRVSSFPRISECPEANVWK